MHHADATMIVNHHAGPCFEEINDAVEALSNHRQIIVDAKSAGQLHCGAIAYNLDLVGVHVRPEAFDRWRSIWDFSQRNIRAWRKYGRRDVVHVPVGYHPSMHRFQRQPPGARDIDVVFVGARNDRRVAILDRLQAAGLRVHATASASREERDDLLSRCRLALNMLYYEDGVFPILRAAHLLANGVPMVSEHSLEMLDTVLQAPYEQLVNTVKSALRRSDEDLDRYAAADLEDFMSRPMVLP